MHHHLGWIGEAAAWLVNLAKAHPEWGFAIALVASFGESFAGFSFFFPGNTVLIALGAILRADEASPVHFLSVWAAGAVGAILGDWISYWLGHRFKDHVLSIWPISRYPDQMSAALAFFGRWGVWAIFLGRFLGPFRATVPLVAGISQMRFWPFQIANVTSALLWSASLLFLGAAGWAILRAAWHMFGGWPLLAVAAILVLTVNVFRERIGSALRTLTPK